MGSVEEGSERASGVGKCGIEWAGLGVVWCVSCMIQIAIPGRDLLFVTGGSCAHVFPLPFR